ncbi:MAG TPA: SDR family oxidoreductase [Marmoricola sp.]|nr:SDR family oxidoreductase [Marmoricola sp.]
MDLDLSGKVFIVTGGSRGLGRATVESLVAEGANVVVSSRNAASLADLEADLGPSARGVAVDNSDPKAATEMVARAIQDFGRVDGALISVGGPQAGPLLTSTEDDWRAAFESVFLGGLRVARAVAAAIDGPGSIAFVLSTSVKTPLANLAISNGLRPGLAMAAKTLANELGPRNIRVNGLLPGKIATDRLAELDESTGNPASARRNAEANIPLGRYGEPAEFAAAATFLLSPRSSYITGAMLAVDGGVTPSL